jgi:hypothetical protein
MEFVNFLAILLIAHLIGCLIGIYLNSKGVTRRDVNNFLNGIWWW